MLYRKHDDAVLKLVQPVLLAPILQRVEIRNEHFPSFIRSHLLSLREPTRHLRRSASMLERVRRAEGRHRPGSPFGVRTHDLECALTIAFTPSPRPELANGTRESAAHRESTG